MGQKSEGCAYVFEAELCELGFNTGIQGGGGEGGVEEERNVVLVVVCGELLGRREGRAQDADLRARGLGGVGVGVGVVLATTTVGVDDHQRVAAEPGLLDGALERGVALRLGHVAHDDGSHQHSLNGGSVQKTV